VVVVLDFRHQDTNTRHQIDIDPSSARVEELIAELKISYDLIAAFILIVNAGSKKKIFTRVKSVSTVDLLLGHVYWWLIENFLIFASTNGLINVPGLENSNHETGQSENSPISNILKVAQNRIKAASEVLKESALVPTNYFFCEEDGV